MAVKRILTLDQLVKFVKKNKMYSFNYKDTGYKLSVQIPSKLVYEEDNDSKNLYATVRVCHTLLNRNGSFISEENMKRAMPSLMDYTPLLGYIHQLNDGTYDFHAHDFDIVEDKDGNETIVYKESQIGTFTVDEPYLEYDEKMDKTYVMARVAIPKEYTRAAEIIERKGGTKVSCELEIESFTYNAKEKYLELIDFSFIGCTCLGSNKDGTEIGEGMLGSRLDIEDFSSENNSVFNHVEYENKLIESLDRLNATLSNFNIDDKSKEGGQNMDKKFEELLEKYSKTKDDVDLDYSEMTEEELESKFEELFGEETSSDDEASTSADEGADDVGEDEPEDEPDDSDDDEGDDAGDHDQQFSNKFSVEFNGKIKTFELALDDKIYALSDLVNATYGETDNTWYGVKVYEAYLIMIDYWTDVAYKQSYKQDGDSFSLTGDRVQVYAHWLTAEEETALDEMRSNYSSIKIELETYKKAEEDAEKIKIFEDEDYAQFMDTEEFKALIKDRDNYSVDELKDKADIAFSKCVRQKGMFNAEKQKLNTKRKQFASAKAENKKRPYGNIFNETK